MSTLSLLAASGCGGPLAEPDGSIADAQIDAGRDAGPELEAVASGPRYALVGETITLDGSASTGASQYLWAFGDGRGWDAPRAEASAEVAYDEPGRHRAVLTVSDAAGRRRTASWLVTVTHPRVHTPRQSGSVAVDGEAGEVAVVSPDSDELAVFDYAGGELALVRRFATADEPRTVARWDDRWAVVCQAAGVVQLFGDGDVEEIALPRASRPFGAAANEGALVVSLQATGELARITPGGAVTIEAAIEDARGVAILPDGRVAVSRWRSPDERAEIAVLGGAAPERWTLAYDPQPGSDTESGGVPSYLAELLVSPTGRVAVVPSLQAAIGEGLFRGPRPLTFETTVRAALSYLDPVSGAEDFERRKLFDDRGLASAGAFSSRGDYLYLAMRGARAIERIDVLTGAQAGSALDVGFAPQGLALSHDDRLLFADAYLSRELVVYDVRSPGALPVELARLPIPSAEPLTPELLLGKRLFNDAADPRLAKDSYIACAHCHLDGLSDRRVWDFTDRGEGLRNTIDLVGRAGAEGPLHWSANFDEVQDFEHDIRGAFRGTGLLSDEALAVGTRGEPLGDPKAGVSAELDALAAYVRSLDAHLPSPHREPDGTLGPAALRGRALFEASGCPSCHAGPALTDSALVGGAPILHDVGTLGPGSGARLGEPLPGLDTPTLHGLWQSAPYLHDGSAPTLRDVLTTRNPADRHGTTSGLDPAQLDDLIAFLLCLDG